MCHWTFLHQLNLSPQSCFLQESINWCQSTQSIHVTCLWLNGLLKISKVQWCPYQESSSQNVSLDFSTLSQYFPPIILYTGIYQLVLKYQVFPLSLSVMRQTRGLVVINTVNHNLGKQFGESVSVKLNISTQLYCTQESINQFQ